VFEHLLAPIDLGPLHIRNRVVMTATSISESWRNPLLPAEPYVEFVRQRAAGGVGLIIAHPFYVNPFGPYPAAILDRHAALADAAHAEGAKLIVQLVHFGATFRTDNDVRRPALWGFDHTVTPEGEPVHKMTTAEIEQVIDSYRRAVRLVADAGCDGVELHGAHGYLLQQSVTPLTNARDDEWGTDRTLFARRLITDARAELGRDRIIGFRTATDDLRSPEDGGLGTAGLATVVQRILDTGEIDVLNTTVGFGGPSYGHAIPNYRQVEGANIPRLRRLRDALSTDVPVIGTGRITSPGVAEALLVGGECDLVAMTRAHIAEPALLRKLTTGQAHRIRPCVGANLCVERKLGGSAETSCFHNPEVLMETPLAVLRATEARRVLVIGAGPAGLKAAEVAARRGHTVRILDDGRRPGGRLRHVEKTAASDLASSLDHLVTELSALEVEIESGIRADEALIRSDEPDFVVLATGARFDPASVPGTGHVVSTSAALHEELTDPVLVYDTLGTNEPALVAEALARSGRQVILVTRYETVMPFGGVLHRLEAPRVWHRTLDRIITGGLLGDLDDGVALIVRPHGETVAEIKVGSVVAATAPKPEVELLDLVQRLGIRHGLAGDAMAPRTAFDSYKEGHAVALTI
jgi:2,4-dienoyl-CoA reductase-like NADH-dependent reductase (Old Yellow Enzyme family)/thioredoxin reductase